jgi:hypothetical protein
VIPTAHLRFCSERGRLLDAYDDAARDYAKAADELTTEMATTALSPEVSRLKRSEVEHARLDAQHAKDALAAHRKEHGC